MHRNVVNAGRIQVYNCYSASFVDKCIVQAVAVIKKTQLVVLPCQEFLDVVTQLDIFGYYVY